MTASAFLEPDWTGPLDLQERLAAAPTTALIKGMFFEQVRETMGDRADEVDPGGHYGSFRDYPMDRWLRFVHDAAVHVFPDFPPKRAVFELARPTFERFKESLLGRVIFTVTSFEDSLLATSKAYRRTSDVARCEVVELEGSRAVLELRGCWDFPHWHVGLFHGGMQTFGKHGHVRMRTHSLSDYDLELVW
jgi:uncharacterized protein (TIGR02265 family)